MADTADRRGPILGTRRALKDQLNESQLAVLYTLERFGWELKFVRRQAGAKTAFLFDPDAKKYAVLGSDGVLDENPIFQRFRREQTVGAQAQRH
jgi:hypothetical protein